MRHHPFLPTLLGMLTLSACTEPPATQPGDGPLLSIEDAVHNGGNEHFFWLPPMVPQPTYDGAFDGTLAPVVEICEWTGVDCVLPLVAEYTTTTGPGSETLRVVPEDEHYIVNWHTDEFGLDETKTYRIVARVDGQELGHADVDVVSNGSQLKNVDTQEYIPLKDGRTLPIKFRIEDGALVTGIWATVGLGSRFGCGITTDGEGYCWGRQIRGEGGTGHANRHNVFVQPIVDGTRTLAAIDGSASAHCALATDGTAWCSGLNTWEVLGTATILPLACGGGNPTECTWEPVMVDGGLSFTEVHVRETHGCGLTTNGAAYCWGGFAPGGLGTGSDGSLEPCNQTQEPANCSRTPAAVRGNHVFTTITVGGTSCGLTAPGDPLGNVWCWGENKWGTIGDGTFDNRYYEPVRGGGGMTFAQIDGGGANLNTCALTDAGVAWCWGYANYGMLGIGDPTNATLCWPSNNTYCAKTPVAVNMPAGVTFTKIAVGDENALGGHVCAIASTKDAYCWGTNSFGQVGNGIVGGQVNEPSLVTGGHKFIDIATSLAHSCGVTVERDIYCWGLNDAGQLGLGAAGPDSPTPVKLMDPTP